MSLRLTPDILAAAYEFVRVTPPFKGWKLPHPDDVGFHVIRDKGAYGDFRVIDGLPTIRISENCVGHTQTLIAKMAHECIHLRQHLTGDKEVHGARFKAAAKRVCKYHGFDPKTF
mgnify:CR=1 FL=1